MLEIRSLEFWYKSGRPVLKDISLELEHGGIACLLGPNGTGKTTLLRCLLGLNKPKKGEILLDGQNLEQVPMRKRASLMAYVPQSSSIAFAYDVREIVMMGRVSHLAPGASHTEADKKAVMECLEKLQIADLAERRFMELSGGERQMVLVARAMAQQARYLIMDEPTANLDYSNQIKILRTIKELAKSGYGVLMTSHYPD
ncbi:MAG: ABC transporter ATP-binding protein, partial [Oscillospiraceae bacterium]|nr:ABC transporter ATP-binding protein [Oscillospiraceae bacterium]